MGKDFFEQDRTDIGSANDPDTSADALSPAGRRRLKYQKDELTTQVADATHEIESLRQRQSALERERLELEELARKQEAYEEKKRTLIDRFRRGLIHLEKDEAQAARFVELLAVMRDRFRDSLAELEGINESGWTEDTFETELNKALVLAEDAGAVYRKGMAKIKAEAWQDVRDGSAEPAVLQSAHLPGELPRRFGFWLKAGFAFALPLVVVATAIFVAAVLLRMRGWW